MNAITGRASTAECLKNLRRARGKKLREVVTETNLFHDIPHLSKLESGKWNFRDIDRLCEYLDYYGYQLAIIKK